MRAALLTLTLLAAALAGCSDSDSAPEGEAPTGGASASAGTVPEPLHFENDVPVGADPFNFVTGLPCDTDASTCFKHEFTLEGTNVSLDVEATLAWMLPANDFDLYLYEGDEQISSDGINSVPPSSTVPETTQVLRHAGLSAGTYSLWVVAWNAVADGYTLDVTFSNE